MRWALPGAGPFRGPVQEPTVSVAPLCAVPRAGVDALVVYTCDGWCASSEVSGGAQRLTPGCGGTDGITRRQSGPFRGGRRRRGVAGRAGPGARVRRADGGGAGTAARGDGHGG